MFSVILILAILVFPSFAEVKNELVLLPADQVGSVVINVPKVLDKASLPLSWDYRTQGLLTADLNQHIPVYCGESQIHF